MARHCKSDSLIIIGREVAAKLFPEGKMVHCAIEGCVLEDGRLSDIRVLTLDDDKRSVYRLDEVLNQFPHPGYNGLWPMNVVRNGNMITTSFDIQRIDIRPGWPRRVPHTLSE